MGTTTQLAIDMGEGLRVRLSDEGDGRWKLAFGQAAPALDAIEVQAIGRNGQCHAMKMFPGPDAASVYASGPVEKAYRVRVVVGQGGDIRTRDVRLPGTADYPLAIGAHGGTLISMGHDSYVEVLPQDGERWKIVFMDGDVPVSAPPLADVKAEAIGAPEVEDQVRGLAVLAGDDAHSLFLEGKVGDAGYLRLAVIMGDHYHTRCVPVTRP
jgi:hypothetical protein